MGLLFVLGFAAADLADSVLDLSRLQVAAAALIALVASGGDPAVRADALYISVGEETRTLGTIGQFDLSGIDVSIFQEG